MCLDPSDNDGVNCQVLRELGEIIRRKRVEARLVKDQLASKRRQRGRWAMPWCSILAQPLLGAPPMRHSIIWVAQYRCPHMRYRNAPFAAKGEQLRSATHHTSCRRVKPGRLKIIVLQINED